MIIKIIHSLRSYKSLLYNSLFDIPFYHSLKSRTLIFSFRYLFSLILIVMYISAILLVTPFVINSATFFSNFNKNYEMIQKAFPDGLSLTINDGSLRTNVDEPYYVDISKSLYNINNHTHLIAFDTKNTFANLSNYQSLIVVTKNNLYVMNNIKAADNEYQTFSLKEINGYYVINKSVFIRFLDALKTNLPYILIIFLLIFGLFFFIFPFLSALFFFIALALYLLLLSFVIYNTFRLLLKNEFSFKRIFHISLHAITVSVIFQLIQYILHISVPYTFTFPFFIWMIYILNLLSTNDYPDTKNNLSNT